MTPSEKRLRAVDEGVSINPLVGERGTFYETNHAAFATILEIYARPGWRIADPTYGRGVFWKDVREGVYNVVATDIETHAIDFTDLPYKSDSFDMVVLDPPYRPGCSHKGMERAYRTGTAAKGKTPLKSMRDVLALYAKGITEAGRVLHKGGFAVVKCQDAVEAAHQTWTHLRIMESAQGLGFGVRDLIVVAPRSAPPATSHGRQFHARKTHSYFLVLRKGGTWPFGTRRTS